MATKQQTDWMGKWYTIAKEYGMNVTVMMAFVNTKKDHIEWSSFSHEQTDGVGGIIGWLNSKGYRNLQVPTARPAPKMSPWKKASILISGLNNLESRKIAWKEINDQAIDPRPQDLAYALFDKTQTAQIESYTKAMGTSFNSYLLAKIHNFLFERLATDGAIGGWVFPVNMRGNLKKDDPYCNQSSGVLVELGHGAAPKEIHAVIKNQLVENRHWANWWVYNVGRFAGEGVMRTLFRRSAERSFFIGTFTNLGAWPPPGAEAPEGADHSNEYFLVGPPGRKNYPISVAIGTWYEKLSITLKIHPFILSDLSKVPGFLDEIKEQILRETGGAEKV